jgi:nitroreductase
MQELTVDQSVWQRRSVKSFKPDAISPALLQKIIDGSLQAPSSFNMQPTRLIVIQDEAQKQALAQACWNQKQIIQAPVTFVYAVSVRGWEKTFEQTLKQAQELGAWSEKTAELFGKMAPGFQNGLGEKQREYAIKDAMITATTTALLAESYGLGSCYMNGFVEDEVKKIIGAAGNPDIAIALVLPVGIPLELPKSPGRLPQELTVFKDRLN